MTPSGGVLNPFVALAAAYVSGSVPSAYLAGKWKGVDLRKHGSGNLGATNVVRVLGAKIGAAVFAVDIAKGFFPVYLLSKYVDVSRPELFAMALGVFAILGHIKPIFLITKGGGGGKGVATAAGVFLGLAPIPMLIAFSVWLLVFLISRYVSLASLVAAVALPIALVLKGASIQDPLLLLALAIGIFVFYTHRANIQRLINGSEHRFKKGVSR